MEVTQQQSVTMTFSVVVSKLEYHSGEYPRVSPKLNSYIPERQYFDFPAGCGSF